MENEEKDPQYLNVEQVARQLDVHRLTVIGFVTAGELKAVKIGRRWRFRQQDVDSFIDEKFEPTK